MTSFTTTRLSGVARIVSFGATLLASAVACGGAGGERPAASAASTPERGAQPAATTVVDPGSGSGSTTTVVAPSTAPSDPIDRAIEAARPALRACYEKARRANPALGRTTVLLKLRADDSGRVTTVDIDYTHRFDDNAKACMREAAFSVKLPRDSGSRVTQAPVVFDVK